MFSDFATPQWLLVGVATVVVLALAMVYADRRRRRALRMFAAATPISTASPARRWLRNVLALIGVAMAFVALARPRGGYRLEQTPHQGIDLVFAVDTSKSMRAADLPPDRLTRAKLAVTDLVRKFQGERVGLIAFAGGAFVQAPMTADHNVFLEALQALDTDVIPRPGTDLSSAIRAATQAMASEPANRKLLVLVSDGENLTGDAVAAAREAANAGVKIFTVGVGTARGDLIETVSPDGTRELVRDEQGNPVRSTLDETTLRSIAQVTGGQYEPLGADGRGLDRLYNKSLANLPKAAATSVRKVYAERYQFPLAIALACLLLELVIRDRKRARRGSRSSAAAAVAAATMLAIPAIASASPSSSSSTPVETYNGGTEAYRHGDFEAAQKQFDGALHTKDVELQEDAYYNLGNARYRLGEKTLTTDKSQTIAAWKTALAAYDAALALAPKDQDAKFNRDLVARKLAALEREQQQQQQGGSKNGQQQNGSSNGQQQNGSSNGQQQNGGSSNGQQQNGSSNGQQQNSGSSNGQQQNGSSHGQQKSDSSNGQHQNSGSSNGQQQNGSSNDQQQNSSNGQRQNGSSNGHQQNSSSNGQQQNSSNGQRQNGSSNSQEQNSSSNGQHRNSSNGQRQNGSSNTQQQNGSSNGQQQNSSSNGQQQNGSSNGKQQGGSSSGQQQNGSSSGPQQNGQQQSSSTSNGHRQPDSSNGQQQNGQQQNSQQQNGQQQNGQQQNGQQQNGQQPLNMSAAGANASRSPTDAERQAQAANVHAPDAATARDPRAPDAAAGATNSAGASSGTQPAAERAAQRAADDARRAAGQLTRGEALQLLDAAEHELKPMPIDGKARAADHSTTTVKDW